MSASSCLSRLGLGESTDRDEAALRGTGEPAAPEGHELVVARIVDRLRLARRLHMLEPDRETPCHRLQRARARILAHDEPLAARKHLARWRGGARSEERRVGEGVCNAGRTRWAPDLNNKNQ